MRVVTWNSENDGAIARIEVPAARGKVEFMPIFFHAPKAEDAAANAEKWYLDEIEKAAGRDQERLARAAKIRASHEAKRAGATPTEPAAPPEDDFPI